MKPRMIFVSPEFPGLPASGGVLRTSFLLRCLARHFDIHCVTFAEAEPSPGALARVRPHIGQLTVLRLEPHRREPLACYVRNMGRAVRFVPPLVDRFAEPEARQALEALLAAGADWVWLEHLWLAPYAASIPAGATAVLDAHNVESEYYRQLRCTARGPFKWMGYYIFEQAASQLEQRYLPRFHRVITVSEEDRQRLAGACPAARIIVLPNAVRPQSYEVGSHASKPSLYFAGRLDYLPNRQGVLWFYQRVWPLVRSRLPEVKWFVVGDSPELLGPALRRDPGIVLTGQVESTEPYLHPSTLVVVPIALGGGTRFKILEAWAAGKAVVSTTKGAEGLAARHGENIWLANTPEEFGQAVLCLLSDPELCARVGQEGWETVREHYSWERVEERLETLILKT